MNTAILESCPSPGCAADCAAAHRPPALKILRASHLGMCSGVRDAIAMALCHPEPLTVAGELVHNEAVLGAMRARGILQARPGDPMITRDVMITAHGASRRFVAALERRGHRVIEATCPLVHRAREILHAMARDGFHPVVVGQRGHAEVIGLTGDLEESDVVLSEPDVDLLGERRRYGVVAQTTQPVAHALRIVACMRRRFPGAEVRFVDTVCRATTLRQQAAVRLARRCDVVVVIGGARSNNTLELAATCGRHCARVHHVQGGVDLRPEWFFAGDTVGVTCGTSTPDSAVEEVERWLAETAAGLEDQSTMPCRNA
jgi:4-hydroxy-3-methylbut-2-enyl diphosphate reductase